jgi:hypothetical protein
MPKGDGWADAVEVPILESVERWTDIKLEDGSAVRVKTVVLSAARLEGQYDGDGNPLYALRAHNVMAVTDAPERLRKQNALSPPKEVQ